MLQYNAILMRFFMETSKLVKKYRKMLLCFLGKASCFSLLRQARGEGN
jgi:hypothetical protein